MSYPNSRRRAAARPAAARLIAPRHAQLLFAGALLVGTSCAHVASATNPPPADTIGEKTTAVILVNFQDNATQPKTRAEANTLVFGTVSDFFWENSYQKTFLSGDTFGWFTLPMSKATCDTATLATQANQAATAAGANLAAYGQVIYMFPSNACSWTGFNKVGPNGERQVFINGTAGFALQPIAHELGHRFGLRHSNALDCDISPIAQTCTEKAYADPADTMGMRGAHFNAFQKELLGWLDATGAPPITTVTASGRYPIAPMSGAGAGSRALKLLKSTDATGQKTWYYVEYRQPTGFDAVLNGRGNLTAGVIVHSATINAAGTATNWVLDMTPNTNELTNVSDFEDGALGVGKTYTDTDAQVAITLVSADASGAVVDVSLADAPPPAPTCTRAAPTVTISGPTAAVAAGTTLNYTVSVANRDSSACAATSFALARSVPAGWVGNLGVSSLTLGPGASGSTQLAVASPASAGAGGYGIGVGTSSAAGSTHVANGSTTYTVATATTPPPAPALSDSVGTDKTSYLRGETVTMSARVLDNGSPAAGASVKFTLTQPGGGATTLTATSGSDGYARTSYKLGKAKSAVGTWQVRADASLSGASATSASSFGVR